MRLVDSVLALGRRAWHAVVLWRTVSMLNTNAHDQAALMRSRRQINDVLRQLQAERTDLLQQAHQLAPHQFATCAPDVHATKDTALRMWRDFPSLLRKPNQ